MTVKEKEGSMVFWAAASNQAPEFSLNIVLDPTEWKQGPFLALEWPEFGSSALLVSSCRTWYSVASVQFPAEAL